MELAPDFAAHKAIAEVHDSVRAGEGELQALRENWRNAAELTKEIRDRLARGDDTRREEIEMEGYRSAADLAATVVAFRDPEFGRQIRATSDAVFAFRDAVRAFDEAKRLDADRTLATLTLSGNVVGTSLVLMSELGVFDSGRSADEIIVEEVGRLREDVQRLRKDVHERFDRVEDGFQRVHEELDSLYSDVVDALNAVLVGNREDHEELLRRLRDTRLGLMQIAGLQLDTQTLVIRQGELLATLIEDSRLAPCLRRHVPEQGDAMTLSKFRNCRALIEAMGDRLPEFQLFDENAARATTTTATWLVRRSDRTVAWSFGEFKRLLRAAGPEAAERADQLPKSVVGPGMWFHVVDTHDRFLSDYPGHAVMDADSAELATFRDKMQEHRSNLNRYAEAIRQELMTFQMGSRETAFSRLLDEAWDPEVVEALLEDITSSPGEAIVDCYWTATVGDRLSLDRRDAEACLESNAQRARDAVLEAEAFGHLEEDLFVAGAHLRSWISLALNDAIGRSDTAFEVSVNLIGLPNVREMVEAGGLGSSSWSWTLAEDVAARIRDFETTLRSSAMLDAAAHGYWHRALTGTRFENLGDVGF